MKFLQKILGYFSKESRARRAVIRQQVVHRALMRYAEKRMQNGLPEVRREWSRRRQMEIWRHDFKMDELGKKFGPNLIGQIEAQEFDKWVE